MATVCPPSSRCVVASTVAVTQLGSTDTSENVRTTPSLAESAITGKLVAESSLGSAAQVKRFVSLKLDARNLRPLSTGLRTVNPGSVKYLEASADKVWRRSIKPVLTARGAPPETRLMSGSFETRGSLLRRPKSSDSHSCARNHLQRPAV